MIHIENIAHILQYGITHISSPNANKNYASIGDKSLITNRNEFVMPNGNLLGAYIPFYFGVGMPMLYVIQKGFNGVKASLPENIIYCVCSLEKIINCNLEYVFTDGHAVNTFSTFYNKEEIVNIEKLLDFKAIKSQYWKDDNDLDLKRRKEAEFLVKNDIPKETILGFCVYNDDAKSKLLSLGIPEKQVKVRNTYYF